MSRIVVGVDGSQGASNALEWAIAEARLRVARLRIVTAWHVPIGAYGAPGFAPAVSPSLRESLGQEAERIAQDAAQRAVDAGLEQVEHLIQEGQAAGILIEAAKDADLLVVGSRGHGGFVGLLLGSVGQQCAHHAVCPLVIVRGQSEEPGGAR